VWLRLKEKIVNVPNRFAYECPAISTWQRAEARGFRAGRDSRITRDQLERLNEIGFVWEDDHGTRSAQLFNPSSSIASNSLLRQGPIAGMQATSHWQQPTLAPYLASSSSLHQLQAQIASLRSVPGLTQSQFPLGAPRPEFATRTETLEHASMFREAWERRALYQNLYPGGFAAGSAFQGAAATSTPFGGTPQGTFLDQLAVHQALQGIRIRNVSTAVPAVVPPLPLTERSLLALSLLPADFRRLQPRLTGAPTEAAPMLPASLGPTFGRSNPAPPFLATAFADEKNEGDDDSEAASSARR
jgi:hypothetical protein